MTFAQFTEAQFNQQLKLAKAGEAAFRERAWAEYLRQGLPDRKTEAWKYSSLAELIRRTWRETETVTEVPEAAARISRQWRADFDVAVVLNGRLSRKHSQLTLEAGYEFDQAMEGADDLSLEDGFVALAAALNRGGFHLRVAPGLVFRRPLLIVHCVTGDWAWSPTLNRVAVGAGSEFQLAEVFVGGSESYLRTDVTVAELGDGARLSWARVQRENPRADHFSEVQLRQSANSLLNLAQVNLGAGWARSSSTATLNGENAEAVISGLTLAGHEQHIDQRVCVRHLAARTTSTQLFKGVLKDHARGVLNGKIHIAKGAQKVSSSQLNHNLLLSPGAEADSKPELEIFADDVKANHGASVGRMDDDELFYLMTRAIPRTEAVRILARAFVGDVLMKMPALALREFLAANVEEILPEFANQMELQ